MKMNEKRRGGAPPSSDSNPTPTQTTHSNNNNISGLLVDIIVRYVEGVSQYEKMSFVYIYTHI